MPNPDAAPQMPGKFVIDLTPGRERIEIDGCRIEQHVTAVKVSYSAKERKPVIMLDLLPSAVELRGAGPVIEGTFRDFLVNSGWTPPG